MSSAVDIDVHEGSSAGAEPSPCWQVGQHDRGAKAATSLVPAIEPRAISFREQASHPLAIEIHPPRRDAVDSEPLVVCIGGANVLDASPEVRAAVLEHHWRHRGLRVSAASCADVAHLGDRCEPRARRATASPIVGDAAVLAVGKIDGANEAIASDVRPAWEVMEDQDTLAEAIGANFEPAL